MATPAVISAEATVANAPKGPAPIFVALTLMAVGVFFVTSWPLGSRSAGVQFGQYAIIVYSALRSAACVRKDTPRIATMVVWLFTYTLFGLVQTVQLSEHQNPFRISASDAHVETQIVLVLVGCVAFDLVSTWRFNRPVKGGGEHRQIRLGKTVVLSLVTLALSPYLLSSVGGLGALFGSREAVSTFLTDSGSGRRSTLQAMVLGFANAAPFVCAFSLYRLHVAGVFKFRKRFELQVLMALLLAMNLVFNNPISQPRFWVATIVIAVAISGRWVVRPLFQYLFVVGFLVATLVVFPYLDVFRYASVGEASLPQQGVVSTYLTKTDYGSAQDVTNAVSYVDQKGHTDGRQLLGVALFWVPRSIWTEKPTDTNAVLAKHIGFHNLNIDSPLWAEGYIDFGFPGAIGVLGIFGFLTGMADRSLGRRNLGAAMVTVLVPIFVGYELILLRGSLLQAVGRLAVFVFLIWLISARPAPGPVKRRLTARR